MGISNTALSLFLKLLEEADRNSMGKASRRRTGSSRQMAFGCGSTAVISSTLCCEGYILARDIPHPPSELAHRQQINDTITYAI